jgi:hypothetical protein
MLFSPGGPPRHHSAKLPRRGLQSLPCRFFGPLKGKPGAHSPHSGGSPYRPPVRPHERNPQSLSRLSALLPGPVSCMVRPLPARGKPRYPEQMNVPAAKPPRTVGEVGPARSCPGSCCRVFLHLSGRPGCRKRPRAPCRPTDPGPKRGPPSEGKALQHCGAGESRRKEGPVRCTCARREKTTWLNGCRSFRLSRSIQPSVPAKRPLPVRPPSTPLLIV